MKNMVISGGWGGVLLIKSKWVCMRRPRLKRRGLTELINLKKWVLSIGAERTVKVVPLELIELGKMGAFRRNGCF